ncbi:hypothetical protein [Nocardia asteroides]|uniref:Uncharacterized protein n=1 Tax=Nocardia asteroides NBRC 15531 TaxID=1110697 RepID=U5EGG5_NOCAS|nr:hypothetical protein [Nocardia asteroides]TLF67069.1 hypothetical protein FEK33_13790 [Nocardia asteroides NBRC 15531]UGT51663.1 hypothetical protein LT345_14405 [Nocardia asteroides]SFM20270.1 hypothetical protein SAMN05444423_102217 [Nocardia asteroides]VEG35434.1 Uncharacterised protein [Nocardia asteroides]GAD86405.1 hypothetical protein NCAST_32_08920 [Nocardia asteroides NBRC 15531]
MISTYLRRLDPRRAVLCLIAGLLATWAFAGALGLITGVLALSPVTESRLPWQSPVVAGVALALVVGLPMTVVALTAQDDPRTTQTTMVAACALIGWILLQLLLLRELTWLQPVCVMLAVVVAALGAPPLPTGSTTRRWKEWN